MFRLPDYEVVVHILYNDFGKKLENDILSESSSYALDESTEYQGTKDYHWAFTSWEEAVKAGERLKKFINNPNLWLLRVKANYDNTIETITHKEPVGPKVKK